jgi:hypothetical protein
VKKTYAFAGLRVDVHRGMDPGPAVRGRREGIGGISPRSLGGKGLELATRRKIDERAMAASGRTL